MSLEAMKAWVTAGWTFVLVSGHYVILDRLGDEMTEETICKVDENGAIWKAKWTIAFKSGELSKSNLEWEHSSYSMFVRYLSTSVERASEEQLMAEYNNLVQLLTVIENQYKGV